MLEIKHLETLTAIRNFGNLQEAAEYLSVTQSALSHQLRELENRLGTTVLNRRTRPARLTTAGLRILALADDILPKIKSTERELQKLATGNTGRLHLAIECHSCFEWLMPALDAYRQQWPQISLDLSAAFSFAPFPALRRGDLDLVITSDPVRSENIDYVPLFKYELVIAVSADNPLSQKRYIKPQDLADQILITYPVEKDRLDIYSTFLDPADVEPAATRTAELTPMIIQLINSNRGVAALPNWTLTDYVNQEWLKTCHLGDPPGIWQTLYAAVRSEDRHATYIQAFLTLAREICFKNLSGIRTS